MARGLGGYLDSIKRRDPAARSRLEILLYPGVWAVIWHRLAHVLYRSRLHFLARTVNHLARFLTAIDIHPGARIGRRLFMPTDSSQMMASLPLEKSVFLFGKDDGGNELYQLYVQDVASGRQRRRTASRAVS